MYNTNSDANHEMLLDFECIGDSLLGALILTNVVQQDGIPLLNLSMLIKNSMIST